MALGLALAGDREDKQGPDLELESIEFAERLAMGDERKGESQMTFSFSPRVIR